jgi:hypothetical protein
MNIDRWMIIILTLCLIAQGSYSVYRLQECGDSFHKIAKELNDLTKELQKNSSSK